MIGLKLKFWIIISRLLFLEWLEFIEIELIWILYSLTKYLFWINFRFSNEFFISKSIINEFCEIFFKRDSYSKNVYLHE